MKPHKGDALLVVDVQKDFLPGGSLAVSDGNAVIPVLNKYIQLFLNAGLPVFATRDWHPPDHSSFEQYGGIWPSHCVAETDGAKFGKALQLTPETSIISKATTPEAEAFSGFSDTSLDKQLHETGVHQLFIGGLATDYCVLNTVKDALKLGYTVFLLEDGIRAVDIQPGDGEKAKNEMLQCGAKSITLEQIK